MLEIITEFISSEIYENYMVPAMSCCKILCSTLNDIIDSININEEKHLKLINCDFNIRSLIDEILNIVKT